MMQFVLTKMKFGFKMMQEHAEGGVSARLKEMMDLEEQQQAHEETIKVQDDEMTKMTKKIAALEK